MTYDLKITNGTIVDGTGKPAFRGDVGVRDGRIVDVGACNGTATATIDADGAIVTPGFTDIHCHYDGQVSWDADLSPSSLHGVTTAVLGNCGVGFAPVREKDHTRLIELMEGVEDIPGSALAEGIRWRWESFPEYMNAVDFPHAIDFALLVPHDPLRLYVMGDRGTSGSVATDDDIATMRSLVRASLEAGAVGFSTGRTDGHRSVRGEATPAAEASVAELQGIVKAFHGLSHGVIQAVSDFDMELDLRRFDQEFDVIEQMAAAASGHSVSISLMQRDLDSEQWKKILARSERAVANGIPLRVQVGARAIGVLLGLETTLHPFLGFPSYKAIASLPLDERVRRMSDPAFKAKLLAEKSEPLAGDGSAIPPIADKFIANVDFVSMRLFTLGEFPDYAPTRAASLYARAMERGISPVEAIYDAMLELGGRQLLYFPIYNYTECNFDALEQMLRHPLALPGLSDGGAHVGTVCDASFPSFMLSYWARDRRGLSLERVVQMLAHDTSRYLGFRDRGTIAPGQRADLNVIDLPKLRLLRPKLVRDLPAGGRRLVQDAEGYRATVVRGAIVRDASGLTGQKPGRLVRAGANQ